MPKTEEDAPDIVQQQIVDKYSSGADSLKQALWNRLRGAEELIVERIPRPLVESAYLVQSNIQIADIKDRARDELVTLCHNERESWRDLKLFKGKNSLARSAQYPVPRPPMWVVAAVVSALVIESIMNGMIFMDASKSYALGGVLQALMLSIVNVALGYFALGFGAARYTGHAEKWKRQLGWSAAAAFMLLGILWNLYVAYLREIAQQQSDSGQSFLPRIVGTIIDAMSQLPQNWFHLQHWQAIVLFMVGLLIFFVLAIEGYHGWDDVYPGYGKSDRIHKNARQDYETAVGDLKTAISNALAAMSTTVAGKVAADERAVEEASEIASEAEQAELEARDSAEDLSRACLEALNEYREANAYVRTTPAPAYFKVIPTLEAELPKNSQIALRLADARSALEANRKAKQTFDASFLKLTQEEAVKVQAFLDGVLKDATFRADREEPQTRI